VPSDEQARATGGNLSVATKIPHRIARVLGRKASLSMNHDDHPPDAVRPQGTVVIVAVFGALVVAGWLLMFFGLFLPRGTH